MELKVYYNSKTDAVIVEIDGIVEYHDEAINSSEYLNNFLIDSIDEYDELEGRYIKEVLEDMMEEYTNHSPDGVETYNIFISTTEITEDMELITTKKFRG